MRVLLAENNERGEITNQCSQIEFSIMDEVVLKLETIQFKGVFVMSTYDYIMIHGAWIKHVYGRDSWVGNMAWNGYTVSNSYGLGLLKVLMDSKEWTFSEGWSNLAKKWESGQEITASDLGLPEECLPLIVDAAQIEIKF